MQARAAHVKDKLKNDIVEAINYAHSEGIDRDDIRNWTWPL
jgi:xylulose-5-phosphate/fructose-6-phosphate phosphoketolase